MPEPALRRGVRLALDWGKARIGVAACDPGGLLSYPVETVAARDRPIERIKALVAEYEPLEVVLGLPVDLRGELGPAARAMQQVALELAAALAPVPVYLADERLTSAEASRRLAQTGKDARARRRMIDQAAAVAILDQVLEAERRTGRRPTRVRPADPAGGEPGQQGTIEGTSAQEDQ